MLQTRTAGVAGGVGLRVKRVSGKVCHELAHDWACGRSCRTSCQARQRLAEG